MPIDRSRPSLRLRIDTRGNIHGIASDVVDWRKLLPGFAPRRASHVEIIDIDLLCEEIEKERPTAGDTLTEEHLRAARRCSRATFYFVDICPLARQLNNPRFAVCLLTTFTRRQDAITAELDWLNRFYVDCADRMQPATAPTYTKDDSHDDGRVPSSPFP